MFDELIKGKRNRKRRRSGPKWTEEEKQIVLELAGEKLARDIVKELLDKGFKKRTAGAVRGVIRRGGKSTKRKHKLQDVAPKTEVTVQDEFDKALAEMDKIRSHAIQQTRYTETVGNPKGANYKVLSISDTHIPFYHNGVIKDAIKKHGDADVLVLNGDILELHSVSRWPKSKAVALKHEYQMAMAWLRKMSDLFPKVVLTKGNHEERLQSYFQANVDPGVSFMTDPDILHRLANGYDFDEFGELRKMHDLDNVHYTKGGLSWFARIGKCIFAHPSGGSAIPMRTSVNTANYFLGREYDFDALVVGHTHKMGTVIWNNKLLIEQGCACVPLEYEATSKMKYRPQAFGYAVVYMDREGNVDFDKSGPVYYGTGSLTPNDALEIE